MALLNALPGAIAEGLLWGLMAIGVYISFKILDIADLTVDGSICTGACVSIMLIIAGIPAWLSIILAFVAGALTGIMTGLFHTMLGIPSILAGILSQLMLYTVNLLILGGKSMRALIIGVHSRLLASNDIIFSIISALTIIAFAIVLLWLFFYTEVGLTLKSTGDNPDMSRAQGVNVAFNKVLGLAISNGIVALAGALRAQYNGYVTLDDGSGAIVIGLAAIFIGLSVSTKIKPNFVVSLIGVVGGGVIYFIIYTFAMMLGIDTKYLKMLSAIIVAIFLAIPYLNGKYFTKPKVAPVQAAENAGGDNNA